MSTSAKLDIAAIIAALPTLNKQDKLAVKAACELLLEGHDSYDPAAVALYGHVAKLTGTTMPYGRVPMRLQGALRAHAAGVTGLVEALWPGQTRVKQIQITRHLLVLLGADLRSRKVPVTVTTIINNLGRLQQVFDDAYPTYREHGLASFILKQLTQGKPRNGPS